MGSAEPGSSPDFAGRASLPQLSRRLERVVAGGSIPLDEAFGEVARGLRRPGIVVVLSDLFFPQAVRGLERLAAGRHQLHVIWMLSPEDVDPSVDPRLRGDLLLRDAETGASLAVSLSPHLRRLHAEALAAHEEELRQTCRRLRAGFTRLSSATPLADVLLRHLVVDGLIG